MSGQTIILAGDRQRGLAKQLIDRAPPRAVLNIREASRSSEQNDKMWAMLGDVSRAKPGGRNKPPHKWKAIFMDACGHKPEYDETLEGDSFICLGYKSSRLSKAQMSDLIECIYEYGARHNVVWSEPKEGEA
jgi:hypothetical protein